MALPVEKPISSTRAAPLPPDERRAAIITAVLPLIVERGAAVTSAQLAGAAGVSEGTIFKVFDDKQDLLGSVVARAVDPEPVERAIASIDPDLPFEQRLVEAARLLQRRLVDVWSLMSQIGPLGIEPERRHLPESAATTELFALEPERLRLAPDVASRRFRALILAFSHPALNDPPLSVDELVDMFLRGAGVDV